MAESIAAARRGLILGKFMPPHLGHVFLGDFARRFVDQLTILVCSLDREPIAGELRIGWMRELFPDCRVIHITENLPQEPSEHPDFWPLWTAAIRRVMPTGPELVFASEPYGKPLADALGSTFIPVDLERTQVPISGTRIRENPRRYWEFIPACVRPHYVKRVCVFGPESTGKTTLARDLARHYQTAWVSEFARGLLDPKDGRCDGDDIPLIALGQRAAEDAMARQANRILFCDTDLLTTTIWSRVLFGSCPQWIEAEANRRRYDLYLLLDVDVPWVSDGQRFLVRQRDEFFAICEQALISRGRRYTIIRGNYAERFAAAIAAVDAIVHGQSPGGH